jgi:ribosomal protein L30/L7E
MSRALELIKAEAPKTPEEARAFLKRLGLLKTTRILEGEEREQVFTMLRLIGPGEESNNQRFWTEEWVIDDKTYQHTVGEGVNELAEITEDDA